MSWTSCDNRRCFRWGRIIPIFHFFDCNSICKAYYLAFFVYAASNLIQEKWYLTLTHSVVFKTRTQLRITSSLCEQPDKMSSHPRSWPDKTYIFFLALHGDWQSDHLIQVNLQITCMMFVPNNCPIGPKKTDIL